MRILHVCAVDFTVKTLLVPQLEYLACRGLDVEIACSPGAETDWLRARGFVVHSIPIARRIAPLSNLQSIALLTRLIRRERYDLVHVHTPIASVLGRIAARLAGTKRIVYTAHGFYFHEHMPRATYRRFHRIEQIAGRITDLILIQSKEDLQTARTTRLCAPGKLRHLGNGIDIDQFRASAPSDRHQRNLRACLDIPNDAFPVVGITGRVTEEKGHAELVRAIGLLADEFPKIRLVVIGGQLESSRDAFQQDLHGLIESTGLAKHVLFAGFRTDVPQLLGLLDIFALPSHREGLPRSILEAMAVELPVVATDIRGCRELVVDGKTGYLVPMRNAAELAKALARLARAPVSRREFGIAGRRRVEDEYQERYVFERLACAYQDLGVVFSDHPCYRGNRIHR